MRPSSRLFELIQILRASSGPVTAAALAGALEVSERTIYRDIAALQAMRTPVEGEAGVGYVLRKSYDLPPLNFDAEEAEALQVGLAMLARTGDRALQAAARRVSRKIGSALDGTEGWLQVAPYGAPEDDPDAGCVRIADLRGAIRDARKLRISYRNGSGEESGRILRPVAVIYHLDCTLLAAWCELRGGFRHFRTDRIWSCDVLEEGFGEGQAALRQLWQDSEGWNYPSMSAS